MISKRVEINRSCNSVNYPTMAVVATSAIKVTSIGVNVQSTRSQTELNNGAVSTIEIIVQFNGQNISSGPIQMTTTDRHDEFFTLPNGGLVVEIGQTFNVVCPYAYCHAYAQNAVVAESGIIINGSAYNMIMNYQYEPVFTYDAQNDGYPYPSGTDPTVFTELEKDGAGYPKNWSAWKYDSNNEGYPWIVGFDVAPVGGSLQVFGANSLEAGSLFVFGTNELIPASISEIFTT
jgi:hypothetical protein